MYVQRVGRNQQAELIAQRNLPLVAHQPELRARYHFVLGNICRERGDSAKAVEHLQIASTSASSDLELFCWLQLRLMATVADLTGYHTALVRLEQVRRSLTRLGDARLFAALHLWLVEVESTRGNLESARRHLKTANAMLAQIDDVWLRGYLAINSSVVHYYSADIVAARRWAQIAIDCSEASGHRATRRAAHSNLGYIEFSIGAFPRAQECFEMALSCCDEGSANAIVILDNIAEIHLNLGELQECKVLLQKIEDLAGRNHPVRRQQFCTWATHTQIKLLLKEGKRIEARKTSERVLKVVDELPCSRLTIESRLLAVETLLANNDVSSAIEHLSPILSSGIQLSPDLFAEAERMRGQALASSGHYGLSQLHLHRAVQTFEVAGHLLGKARASADLEAIQKPLVYGDEIVSLRSLDRIRTLLETRGRPELFGCESVSLLEELQCNGCRRTRCR